MKNVDNSHKTNEPTQAERREAQKNGQPLATLQAVAARRQPYVRGEAEFLPLAVAHYTKQPKTGGRVGTHCEAQNYDSKTGWHGGRPGANHHEPTPGTTATGAKRPPQRAGKEEAKPGTEAGRKASEAQPAARAAAAEPQEPEPPPENGADGDTPGGQGPGRKETKQPPAATDCTKASERAAKAARPTAGPKPAEPTAHTDSPAAGETHPPRAGADTAPGAPKAARHTADTPDTQPTATAGRDGRAASAAQKAAAADTQAARPHEQGPGEQEQERGPDTPTSGKPAARATGEEGADTGREAKRRAKPGKAARQRKKAGERDRTPPATPQGRATAETQHQQTAHAPETRRRRRSGLRH